MERVKLETDHPAPVLRESNGQLVTVSPGTLASLRTELLVIGVRATEDEFSLPDEIAAYDKNTLHGALSELIEDAEFKGKAGSSTDVLRVAGASAKRIMLYGLGDKDDKYAVHAGKAASSAVTKATAIKAATSCALWLDADVVGADGVLTSVAEMANLAAFKDERFKSDIAKDDDDSDDEDSKDKSQAPTEIVLVGSGGVLDEAALSRGYAIARGIVTTKELVMAPSNSLVPESLAAAARQIAADVGLDVKVLGRAECLELGMGSYLGVAQGSIREPQFIHLTYTPDGPVMKRISLVGKAVCFDSGGYNIKAGVTSGIADMKIDMAGSGAVLGTAVAIGKLRPKGVEVHFIMPACENMISERAIHPGDVLRASNGKTIEVMNTDAEGRLCLADALVYAENLGEMDGIIDIATLTGAIVAALGPEMAGMWTPDEDMAERITAASEKGGEKVWRMPLVDNYKKGLKSKTADMRNIGKGGGGSATVAALFLKEFVKSDKWIHLDIAGTATSSEKVPTGWGVKTMLNFVEGFVE